MSGAEVSRADRHAAIRELLGIFNRGEADRAPAEKLRLARFVPGWSVDTRAGFFEVNAGDDSGVQLLSRKRLVAFLTTTWLPAARAELAEETTTP